MFNIILESFDLEDENIVFEGKLRKLSIKVEGVSLLRKTNLYT